MVVFAPAHPVGKAEGHRQLHLVFRLVLAVAAAALRLPELDGGERPVAGELRHIVDDAVFIAELRLLEAGVRLVSEQEGHAVVDDRLPLDRVGIVFERDVDVGEDREVGPPADLRAGGAAAGLLLLKAADILPVLEMQGVFKAVAVDLHVHVFGGILGRAEPQPVEAEGVFVALPLVGLVFAARIELAEDELPVVALLPLVVVHRDAPAEILDLDRLVAVAGDEDLVPVPLARLVDRVGENLKHRVLAALQPVRAEDYPRALAYPVGALEGGNTLVAVIGGPFFWHLPASVFL